MNFPCGPLDTIQLATFILFILLTLQSLLGIGLGIGFLVQPPLYGTIINLNSGFNRQAYFSIYAPHILLIIGSGLVLIPVILGIVGVFQRRWRYLIISLTLLSLYIATLSAAAACGFAYYDRLRPTLETDFSQTSASVWESVRTTYSCTGTNCITALENAMYSNKQRIAIISVVFLLVPSLTILMIMFQMRRDILYFK